MIWITSLFFIAILIALNALYVTAEFSTVSARKSRLSALAQEGSNTAQIMLNIIENPHHLDAYVATCQVGITISSLVLGYIGQSRLGAELAPLMENWFSMPELAAQSASATIILLILSVFQVLIGELIPKNVGIQFPEQLTILTHLPMEWSSWFFKPLIWLFNGSGILIMKLMGTEAAHGHAHIHSPEEIGMLAEESRAGGVLNKEEHRLLKNTLQFRASMIKHVMIPRARMLIAPANHTPSELLKKLAESPYSRIPIYTETVDNIVGVIHLRDLLCNQVSQTHQTIAPMINSVPFVTESMSVKDVFALLQHRHFQVAIVIDEFGGTAGMVTLEDLLEQIFGDLQDEFDTQHPTFLLGSGRRVWIRADARITEVNEHLNLGLNEEEISTLGGLLLNEIGHVPVMLEIIKVNDVSFRIEEMTGRGISLVSVVASDEQYNLLSQELKN